jgi:hypothetical protein
MTDTTCYAIACGEYSDYGVCAVFTTKAAAEAALPAYLDDSGRHYCRIEEFPLDPTIPLPPLGESAFYVARQRGEPFRVIICAPIDVKEEGPLKVLPWGLVAHVFARDKDHAIKIASERFAQYDAQQVGIS